MYYTHCHHLTRSAHKRRSSIKGYGQLMSTRHHVRGRIVWSNSHNARGSYSGYGNSISGSAESECRRWAPGVVHSGDCDVTDNRVARDDSPTSDDVMLTRVVCQRNLLSDDVWSNRVHGIPRLVSNPSRRSPEVLSCQQSGVNVQVSLNSVAKQKNVDNTRLPHTTGRQEVLKTASGRCSSRDERTRRATSNERKRSVRCVTVHGAAHWWPASAPGRSISQPYSGPQQHRAPDSRTAFTLD